MESDDDEAPAAAAGAGGAAPLDLDSVTMTNKAGSYVVDWHKVENIRVDARTGPRSKPAMLQEMMIGANPTHVSAGIMSHEPHMTIQSLSAWNGIIIPHESSL